MLILDTKRTLTLLTLCLLLHPGTSLLAGRLGETSEREFGGAGTEPGKFLGLQDMVFDAKDRIYALDGYHYWGNRANKRAVGNTRVQIFDFNGKFLASFSILIADAGDKNNPGRLAVDSRCHVFVTQNELGTVVEYAPPAGWAQGRSQPDAEWKVVNTYNVPVRCK